MASKDMPMSHTREDMQNEIKDDAATTNDPSTSRVVEWEWETDPNNPYNWPKAKKNAHMVSVALMAFTASIGTSIISPAHNQLIEQFDVSSTVAFLPLSLYVLALGLGPLLGGPLSETAGRRAVYIIAIVLGGLFALGSGLANTFVGLCFMRFLCGFFWGPVLAVGSGVLSEIYTSAERGIPSALFILCPFLGPGFGPVLGVFLVSGKDWRWTQYCLVFFAVVCLPGIFYPGETYHPKLMRRRMKQLGLPQPEKRPLAATIGNFLRIGLLRPLHMMCTEPIVAYLCLYIAVAFGTLFMFFGAFFYVFSTTYRFTSIQSGLVFLAIAFGCFLSCMSVVLWEVLGYRPRAQKYPKGQAPPELRLIPAMLTSVLLPISLFWFGWSARPGVNPAVPIIAIAVFGWGNLTLFISAMQYMGDTYHHSNVASASSANSLARYCFAAGFPLFSLRIYEKLGTGWATSILGFVTVALLPGTWLLFKHGQAIRAKSHYKADSL